MDEEVNRDKTGEADGINLEVDSKDEVMHICPLMKVRQIRSMSRVQILHSALCSM